ncbi:MAG TPA: DUF1761 domain-containing protein [Actinomycetota bacterium]
MIDLNYAALAAAVASAFVISTTYYIVLGRQYAEARGLSPEAAEARPPAWKILVELARSLVVAAVVAGLAGLLETPDLGDAAGLGLALWIAFPVVLLVGSVTWDAARPRVAAIHAGDWLVKLVVIASIVGLWR